MYTNTHVIRLGKVINKYVEPTNRRFKPGSTNILITIEFKNKEQEYIRIPLKYNPQIGDVFDFEIYESMLLGRKKFIIKESA